MRALWMACVLALIPEAALAATTPQGVALKVRRGFFTETDIGTFFTLGGADVYSNAQSYLQLGLGYDLSDRVELGAHFGMGANSFNCFAQREATLCPTTDSFTVTFFDVTVAYLQRMVDRFYFTPKVAVGYTLLDPSPVRDITRGLNVGAGVGFEYATQMDHFSLGLDVLGRYVIGAGIPAFTIYPRIKYTF